MTPSEVTAYLDALRGGNCMSAEIVLPGGAALRVVLAPDMGDGPTPGKPVTGEPVPGGWKAGTWGTDQ